MPACPLSGRARDEGGCRSSEKSEQAASRGTVQTQRSVRDPSTLEPASISQLEAMAFSLPVVCSDTNGTAVTWKMERTDGSFAITIRRRFWNGGKNIADPCGMEKMGANSYRMICDNCQIEAYLQGIEELLQRLKEMGTI